MFRKIGYAINNGDIESLRAAIENLRNERLVLYTVRRKLEVLIEQYETKSSNELVTRFFRISSQLFAPIAGKSLSASVLEDGEELLRDPTEEGVRRYIGIIEEILQDINSSWRELSEIYAQLRLKHVLPS